MLDSLSISAGERDFAALTASDPALGPIRVEAPQPQFPRFELPVEAAA